VFALHFADAGIGQDLEFLPLNRGALIHPGSSVFLRKCYGKRRMCDGCVGCRRGLPHPMLKYHSADSTKEKSLTGLVYPSFLSAAKTWR
jgi:hypothetical protein